MQIKSYFKCDLDLHRETVFLNTSDSISEGFFLDFFLPMQLAWRWKYMQILWECRDWPIDTDQFSNDSFYNSMQNLWAKEHLADSMCGYFHNDWHLC